MAHDGSTQDMLPYRRLWQAYVNQMFLDITRVTRRKDDLEAEDGALAFFDRESPWFQFVCEAAGYSPVMIMRFYRQAVFERANRNAEVHIRKAIRWRYDGRYGRAAEVLPFVSMAAMQQALTTSCGA